MCHMYASTDPDRYASTTRSVRLRGYVTSVRLENEFWTVLEELAATQGMTPATFISTLHGEVCEDRGEVGNLASMLRVACAVYLRSIAEARMQNDAPHAAMRATTGAMSNSLRG